MTSSNVVEDRIPVLDGFRALAIIVVVWHNVGVNGILNPESVLMELFQFLFVSGWVGVQLFFVLSGFLITGILIDSRRAQHALGNFYMRRMLRIFPLYYLTIILYFFVLPLFVTMPESFSQTQGDQLWYWLYLVNWVSPFVSTDELPHFWSLAVEEQFYLLWPLLVMFVSNRKCLLVCLALMVSAVLSRLILDLYFQELVAKAAYQFTIARWDALAIGAALAIVVREPSLKAFFSRNNTRFCLLISGLLLLQVCCYKGFQAVGSGMLVFNQTLVALWCASVMFIAMTPAKNAVTLYWQSILSHRVLYVIAKYSYAIYIIHVLVYRLWYKAHALPTEGLNGWRLLLNINVNCLVVFLVSMVLAWLSWVLLESRFLKLKRFFPQGKLQGRPK